MAKSDTLSETPNAFEQAWKEFNSSGIASGWEMVAFTSGFGAGFKAGMAAGRLQGLEEAAKLAEHYDSFFLGRVDGGLVKRFSETVAAAIREKANG